MSERPTFWDRGGPLWDQGIADLRAMILEHLASVFGEPELPDEARCPECGARLRIVVNGWAVVWCSGPCGWFADEKWLLEEVAS